MASFRCVGRSISKICFLAVEDARFSVAALTAGGFAFDLSVSELVVRVGATLGTGSDNGRSTIPCSSTQLSQASSSSPPLDVSALSRFFKGETVRVTRRQIWRSSAFSPGDFALRFFTCPTTFRDRFGIRSWDKAQKK